MSFGIGFFQRDFNPLRPCGRRHLPFATSPPHLNFNPLRPCGRRPVPLPARFAISCYFNPLRPCGRRPLEAANKRLIGAISIHSARVGGDPPVFHPFPYGLLDFNPLRPCGRRQQKKPFFRLLSISITTYFTEKSKRTRCKFSHLGYLFQYSLLILVRTSLYVDV